MKSALILAILLALFPKNSKAETLAIAKDEGVTISLTDEGCPLQYVSNLPFRATWKEDNKSFEGCYGVHPIFGLITAFFNDGTVAIFPKQLFKRATGI